MSDIFLQACTSLINPRIISSFCSDNIHRENLPAKCITHHPTHNKPRNTTNNATNNNTNNNSTTTTLTM